jgi:hypothetical protein
MAGCPASAVPHPADRGNRPFDPSVLSKSGKRPALHFCKNRPFLAPGEDGFPPRSGDSLK